jgi:hypothetical protein
MAERAISAADHNKTARRKYTGPLFQATVFADAAWLGLLPAETTWCANCGTYSTRVSAWSSAHALTMMWRR